MMEEEFMEDEFAPAWNRLVERMHEHRLDSARPHAHDA